MSVLQTRNIIVPDWAWFLKADSARFGSSIWDPSASQSVPERGKASLPAVEVETRSPEGERANHTLLNVVRPAAP